jgi:hypothetical protein
MTKLRERMIEELQLRNLLREHNQQLHRRSPAFCAATLQKDVDAIRAAGAASVIISRDLGQPNNPLHPDGSLALYQGSLRTVYAGGDRADDQHESGQAAGAGAVGAELLRREL